MSVNIRLSLCWSIPAVELFSSLLRKRIKTDDVLEMFTSTPCRSDVMMPTLALTVYFPGGRFGIRTLPSLPLVADCGRIKLTLVTVKVTFGTPIPSVSLTRPTIAPVVAVCARELVAKRNVKRERLAVEMKYIETLIRNRLLSA